MNVVAAVDDGCVFCVFELSTFFVPVSEGEALVDAEEASSVELEILFLDEVAGRPGDAQADDGVVR